MVDTGAPGWPVVYCSPTWQAWTGMPREAVLHRRLSQVVQLPADAADLQQDVALGAQFVMPRVHVRARVINEATAQGGQGAQGGWGAGQRCFDLAFRPAAVDLLDKHTPVLGIPGGCVRLGAAAGVTRAVETATRYYAVSLHAAIPDADAAPAEPLSFSSRVSSCRDLVRAPHAAVPQVMRAREPSFPINLFSSAICVLLQTVPGYPEVESARYRILSGKMMRKFVVGPSTS